MLEGVHFFSYLKARAKKISKNKIFMVMTGCIHELKAKKKMKTTEQANEKKTTHTHGSPSLNLFSESYDMAHFDVSIGEDIYVCVIASYRVCTL